MTRPACPANNVCPRTGRHPMRRKKNCLAIGLLFLVGFMSLQLLFEGDQFSALQPLADAESEGRRLLKMITHYQYQCNSTFQVGNRSHWPICTDRVVGLDLDSKELHRMYSIGWNGDLWLEKTLSANFSFKLYIVSPNLQQHHIRSMNNTFLINKAIVPNDYADFTRNSYNQQTINDLMSSLGHQYINVLQLINLHPQQQMWELLHFMINDNLLFHVDQLQIALNVDKLEEDFLYSWYHELHELFYKEGFRLIHTSSSDSLCLQVTMMQSCIYYMTWVRNPGSLVFVLHPPALYGRREDEKQRLISYVSSTQTECKQHMIGGKSVENLHFLSASTLTQWVICGAGGYGGVFRGPCQFVRFRSNNDILLEGELVAEGCDVTTIEPSVTADSLDNKFKVHRHHPFKINLSEPGHEVYSDELMTYMANLGAISVIEVDMAGYEWEILTMLLDSGILEQNTTQLVANLYLPHHQHGYHPTDLRTRYSELQRLAMQDFLLFYSAEHTSSDQYQHPEFCRDEQCCFKTGFIKRDHLHH